MFTLASYKDNKMTLNFALKEKTMLKNSLPKATLCEMFKVTIIKSPEFKYPFY